jgi:branched-chain amino acid transport system substrate-binding protein
MRQFPLPPRHEELLNKTFSQDQWREDKKLAGFSGASVYQIIYRNNPVVVKIAPPAVIQREQAGYHDFVLDNLHHHAPKLGGYYESADQQEAILRYTYAGSVARSQTLFAFLERPNQKAVTEVCTILEKMFTLNQSDHPKSWWERAERKSIRSAEYYDRWLPVQLVLEQLPAAVKGATLLQAQRLSLTDIAALTAGDFVLLQDFQVEKQEAGVVTLYAGRPEAPSFRVKVRGMHSDQEGAFPAFYAVVKETRSMLLERYAEETVGAFAMHAPRFTVEGQEYHNPFYYLDELLNTRYEAYLATIHGDFNLRNILLEEKSQPGANAIVRLLANFLGQKSYDWWLIDFASAQTGPVLLDLQWLETQVINWLLVPALQRAGQGPQTLVQVLEGLQRRRALYFQLRTGELRAVYSLLQEIRRLAEGYLAEPTHNPDRWQEYYRGLTLALAATLKQEALSSELGHQAKKFALVAAATTVRWAGVKLVAPARQSWQPLSRLLLATTLVSLLTVAGVYYLVPPGEEEPRGVPPTITPPLEQARVPITIGVAIDQDGSELLLGEDQNNAALLAGDFFSQTIPGVHIVVKVVNAGNTVEKAAAAMHKLIDDYQVVAISGPTLSSQALQVDRIPNAAGVPIIAPSNTVPGIPDLGCYVARVSPPVTLIDPLTLIGATQKLPRGGDVVVAYRNDNEFTIAEAQVFTQTLAATYSDYRFTLQATIAYTKEADFAQQATQILRHQPDLIMIAGLPKDGGTLVFELRQQQYDSYIIGGNGFNTSQIFEVCEECSKILLAQAFDSRLEKASNMRRQFIERYQQRYPERPSPIAAQMFSAIQVLVEALTELNQATPVTVATPLNELRDGINRRLLSGKPFVDTPLGAIAFAPNGEILQEQFYLAETKADAQGRWYFDTFATRENEALDVLRTAPTDCPDGYLP